MLLSVVLSSLLNTSALCTAIRAPPSRYGGAPSDNSVDGNSPDEMLRHGLKFYYPSTGDEIDPAVQPDRSPSEERANEARIAAVYMRHSAIKRNQLMLFYLDEFKDGAPIRRSVCYDEITEEDLIGSNDRTVRCHIH